MSAVDRELLGCSRPDDSLWSTCTVVRPFTTVFAVARSVLPLDDFAFCFGILSLATQHSSVCPEFTRGPEASGIGLPHGDSQREVSGSWDPNPQIILSTMRQRYTGEYAALVQYATSCTAKCQGILEAAVESQIQSWVWQSAKANRTATIENPAGYINDLASQWPCVRLHGLNNLMKGDGHPAYTPEWMNEWMNEWFIGYSSWMLDFTWKIKTLIKTTAYSTKLQHTCHLQYTVI